MSTIKAGSGSGHNTRESDKEKDQEKTSESREGSRAEKPRKSSSTGNWGRREQLSDGEGQADKKLDKQSLDRLRKLNTNHELHEAWKKGTHSKDEAPKSREAQLQKQVAESPSLAQKLAQSLKTRLQKVMDQATKAPPRKEGFSTGVFQELGSKLGAVLGQLKQESEGDRSDASQLAERLRRMAASTPRKELAGGRGAEDDPGELTRHLADRLRRLAASTPRADKAPAQEQPRAEKPPQPLAQQSSRELPQPQQQPKPADHLLGAGKTSAGEAPRTKKPAPQESHGELPKQPSPELLRSRRQPEGEARREAQRSEQPQARSAPRELPRPERAPESPRAEREQHADRPKQPEPQLLRTSKLPEGEARRREEQPPTSHLKGQKVPESQAKAPQPQAQQPPRSERAPDPPRAEKQPPKEQHADRPKQPEPQLLRTSTIPEREARRPERAPEPPRGEKQPLQERREAVRQESPRRELREPVRQEAPRQEPAHEEPRRSVVRQQVRPEPQAAREQPRPPLQQPGPPRPEKPRPPLTEPRLDAQGTRSQTTSTPRSAAPSAGPALTEPAADLNSGLAAPLSRGHQTSERPRLTLPEPPPLPLSAADKLLEESLRQGKTSNRTAPALNQEQAVAIPAHPGQESHDLERSLMAGLHLAAQEASEQHTVAGRRDADTSRQAERVRDGLVDEQREREGEREEGSRRQQREDEPEDREEAKTEPEEEEELSSLAVPWHQERREESARSLEAREIEALASAAERFDDRRRSERAHLELEAVQESRGWASLVGVARLEEPVWRRRRHLALEVFPGEGFFTAVTPLMLAPWAAVAFRPTALVSRPVLENADAEESLVAAKVNELREERERANAAVMMFPALVWTHAPLLAALVSRASRFAAWTIGTLLKKQRLERRELTEEEIVHHLLALLAMGGEFTFNHSRRVMDLSLALCEEMGIKDPAVLHQVKLAALLKDVGEMGFLFHRETKRWRERAARFVNSHDLHLAGVLHDMGKLRVPHEILYKPGKLTEEEFAMMKMHPVYSEQILYPFKQLRHLCPAVRGHHERWDGKGYPDGLKGDKIPLAARIIAVADVFDALFADRPYRAGMPLEKVVKIIEEGRGTHFDPALIDPFLRAVEGLQLER